MLEASEQMKYFKDLGEEVEDIHVLLEGTDETRHWLWILIVVVGLVVMGGLVYFFWPF